MARDDDLADAWMVHINDKTIRVTDGSGEAVRGMLREAAVELINSAHITVHRMTVAELEAAQDDDEDGMGGDGARPV